MIRNSKLQSAVKVALGISAGTLAIGASPGALAQEVDALEEIIVTGSRIKRADLDSASPVTVIDREAIMAQGITDVGMLIQRMPSTAGTKSDSTSCSSGSRDWTFAMPSAAGYCEVKRAASAGVVHGA